MLKLNDVVAVPLSATVVFAPSARKLFGTKPVRNDHQDPTLDGSPAESAPALVRDPGWATRPMTMPMITAMNAVMANHHSVWIARRAAFVTSRRLAMELTMAVKTSGMTATVSSLT